MICLVTYYRKAKVAEASESSETEQENLNVAQAFAELIEYIESQHGETPVLNPQYGSHISTVNLTNPITGGENITVHCT